MQMTGMPASFACCSTLSHPVSTSGEKAMTSTFCRTNEAMASISLCWLPLALTKRSSTPISFAALWMETVLSVRQPLSLPT